MKMKNFTILFSLLFISAIGFSQSFNYYYDNHDTVKLGNVGDHVTFSGHVINNSGASLSTRWDITTNFPDASWQFYVCDDNACYNTGVASRIQSTPANDTSIVKVSIIPGTTAIGTAVAKVSDANDGTIYQEYLLTVDGTTSTNDLASVVVFSQNAPNPFNDFTLVQYDLKGNEGRLIVTDVAGRQINDYQLNENGQVRIGDDLNSGVYFYSLLVDGRVVTTKRLQKL